MTNSTSNFIPILGQNGNFFDMVDKSGVCLITDYSWLYNNIIVSEENMVTLGKNKEKNKIPSIGSLKEKLRALIQYNIKIFHEFSPVNYLYHDVGTIRLSSHHPRFSPKLKYYSDFMEINMDLLVDQLIMDILYEKYMNDSPPMTRWEYAHHISNKLYHDSADKMIQVNRCTNNINTALESVMKKHKYRISKKKYNAQLKALGVRPSKYHLYYSEKMLQNSVRKKAKVMWDYLYYNSCTYPEDLVTDENYEESKRQRISITAMQYRRRLTRKGNNYPYKQIIEDLQKENDFINKMFFSRCSSDQDYFTNIMDYYRFELYKRIDFMFKFIDKMPAMGITPEEIDKDHFLLKRFVPNVLRLYVKKKGLTYGIRKKYYTPLLIIEEKIHRNIIENPIDEVDDYMDLLTKYQYLRARTLELFRYHFTFDSSDYSEFKDFLNQNYNLFEYHNSNKIWQNINGRDFDTFDTDEKKMIKNKINLFFSLNDIFFSSPNNQAADSEATDSQATDSASVDITII